MSETVRYVCVGLIEGRRRFFLWESDGPLPDRVVVDDSGAMLAFDTEDEVRGSSPPGCPVSDQAAATYDFDALRSWCSSDDASVDCSSVLNAWNLFGDLPHTQDLFARADSRADVLYEKLFLGCNLPAMTPPGAELVPSWSSGELTALKHLLMLGLMDFRSRCLQAPAAEPTVLADATP